jgi:peptidoglycan/xylan/chitin deacetylase (PgdA/CDA1 family)
VAILAFHNTGNTLSPGLNNYSPKRLKRLLEDLISAGYNFMPLGEYIRPDRGNMEVAITFDDGYDSFYEYAWPILTENKIPATVFIPYGFIGKRATWDYAGWLLGIHHMSREQIKEIAASGIEIGSHGYSHVDLTGLLERGLKLELERSKKGLEDLTGNEVRYLSYPFGRYNRIIEGTAAEYGYERGLSLSFFKKSRTGFTIPRFAVYSVDTLYAVEKKLGGGFGNSLEKIKGAIMNMYAYGTIFINKFRADERPEYR